MKLVRTIAAILIDPFACKVSRVDLIRDDLQTYYDALSHETMPVKTFEVGFYGCVADDDALFFDEEGLFKNATRAFRMPGMHTPVLGKALIIGRDGKGISANAVTKIESISVDFFEVRGNALINVTTEPWTGTKYRLGSTEMVNAYGLIRWAINGAHFEKDVPAIVNVVSQTWNIPEPAARKLVTGEVPYTVENNAVVFTA
jgi:hypothetical protein